MAYSVEPLSPELAFGCQLTDLRHQDVKSAAVREELLRLWIDKGLIVFRGCEVTPETASARPPRNGPMLRYLSSFSELKSG